MTYDLVTARTNFILELWFHPDLVLQNYPPMVNQYLFLTDNHQIYYDTYYGKFRIKITSNGMVNYFDLGDNVYYYGWNHLIFSNVPADTTKTEISASLSNNFLASEATIGTVDGSASMRYICFCNVETCCGASGVTWMDVWLGDMKIWDAANANMWTVMNQFKL